MLTKLKHHIPWRAKLWLKIILARLPISYHVWRRFGLFVRGANDQSEFSLQTLQHHLSLLPDKIRNNGFSVLEIGCGDSINTALIAKAFGANKTYLIDIGNYAHHNMKRYLALANQLEKIKRPLPFDITQCHNTKELLEACNASYLTDGLNSLRQISSNSVDLVFSEAVLEHILLDQFDLTLQEHYRILTTQGIGSHTVDLNDHLCDKLNHLRYPQQRWESPLFKNSGFYTNRLRYPHLLQRFEQANLGHEVYNINKWPTLPTPRHCMVDPFKGLSENQLTVRNFKVILRPRKKLGSEPHERKCN